MGTICGILGKKDPDAVSAMVRSMKHRGEAIHLQTSRNYAVACASDPVVRTPCLVDGAPRGQGNERLTPKAFRKHCVDAGKPGKLALSGPFAAVLRVKGVKGTDHWWLLRDRLGIKPLYYYQSDKCLVFASELKGILASGLVPKRLNLLSVDHYLTFRCVPGPDSIIQGVRRVSPGHVLSFENGKTQETRFAEFRLDPISTTRASAAARIEFFLEEALRCNEAPGLLWSSGIDCASLAALDPTRRPIHVVLQRAWQNELRLARESARRLHIVIWERKAQRLNDTVIRRALYHLDEPMADATVLPLWLIIEEAAKTEKGLVTGFGADQLLGGYPRYHFIHKAQGSAQHLVPTSLLSSLLPALPPNAFIQRGSSYLARMGDNLDAYLSLLSVFDETEREELYTEAMKAVVHQHADTPSIVHRHFEDADLTRNLLSLDLNVTLPDIGLAQYDRIAAAHGASIEFPYLHDPLVDLATTLPANLKFGVRSKPLLRLAMKKRLPGRVRMRARRGFHVPQEGYVMGVVERFAQQTLTPERVESSGLFKWHHVERIMRSHSHNIYRRRQFWSLLMFFGWYREIMET